MGTASHNTVMLGEEDQMKKGGRFIWYYWSQAVNAQLDEKPDRIRFSGKIHAFRQLAKNIFHQRDITYSKDQFLIEVIDTVENAPKEAVLRWHVHPDFESLGYEIQCFDEQNNLLTPSKEQAWHSSYYGIKEHGEALVFRNNSGYFRTVIGEKTNNLLKNN